MRHLDVPHRCANAELPVSVDLFRLLFDLPARMRIVGAVNDHDTNTVRLLVVDESLPQVEVGAPRYEIQPIFQRVETGKCVLQSIQIRAPQ